MYRALGFLFFRPLHIPIPRLSTGRDIVSQKTISTNHVILPPRLNAISLLHSRFFFSPFFFSLPLLFLPFA